VGEAAIDYKGYSLCARPEAFLIVKSIPQSRFLAQEKPSRNRKSVSPQIQVIANEKRPGSTWP
jgi:hypothetical protein